MELRTKISTRGRRIPGVLPSTRFGELVLSTGIPSLDGFIGRGVPINGITLLGESFVSTCHCYCWKNPKNLLLSAHRSDIF